MDDMTNDALDRLKEKCQMTVSDTDERVPSVAYAGVPAVLPACLTEKEAAIYINMSPAFLRTARMTGPLKRRGSAPPFLRNGRTIRYLKVDLDAWLQSLRVIQTAIDD